MNKKLTVQEKLKEKYHKCEEVTNFKAVSIWGKNISIQLDNVRFVDNKIALYLRDSVIDKVIAYFEREKT